MHAVIALATVGVEIDVLGLAQGDYSNTTRKAVLRAFSRSERFKNNNVDAFHEGFRHETESTFGTVNADVIASKKPHS